MFPDICMKKNILKRVRELHRDAPPISQICVFIYCGCFHEVSMEGIFSHEIPIFIHFYEVSTQNILLLLNCIFNFNSFYFQ